MYICTCYSQKEPVRDAVTKVNVLEDGVDAICARDGVDQDRIVFVCCQLLSIASIRRSLLDNSNQGLAEK